MYSIPWILLSIGLNPAEHPRSEVANGIIVPQDLIVLQKEEKVYTQFSWVFNDFYLRHVAVCTFILFQWITDNILKLLTEEKLRRVC